MAGTLRQQRHVVAACYLGWTPDAFDFFIMILALDDVAKTFGTTRTVVTWAITLTLAMRPLGAFLFGRMADRFGRRPTLMANVLIYSVLELASGFAPNLLIFMVLRALYGIAMGGEWGVGSSLTMESIPARWRGPVSGLLQAGYPSGFLLATLLYRVAYTSVGWRGMFMIGAVPALLVLYIRRNVPESPDWSARGETVHRASFVDVIRRHIGLTIYAVCMMAAFNFFSHGTQDLYKSFLTVEHKLPIPTVSNILIFMNIAAMLGGILCAALSQRIGRRRAIVGAALLALPVLPLWAFSTNPLWLGVGAFLMQLCVQGAWGVIPAHLNELSPPEIRGTFPGLTYQLGNLIAASNATIQSTLADDFFHKNLAWPLAGVAGCCALVIALLVGLGREARDMRMGSDAAPASPATYREATAV
jgi:SHS family lactate transporter-like MFS transporter